MPKKIIISPVTKKLWKTFPIFLTFRSGKFFKIALFWEKIVKIGIFWGEKLQKFANLGVKIEKSRVKSIKFCTYWVKVSPTLILSHPPYFYLAEYSPMFLVLHLDRNNYKCKKSKICNRAEETKFIECMMGSYSRTWSDGRRPCEETQ